jgi:hypothetical protein
MIAFDVLLRPGRIALRVAISKRPNCPAEIVIRMVSIYLLLQALLSVV